MYSSDLPIIEYSENIANEVIYEKDSKLYVNFFETVEKFISENNLIVSGNTANALLCDLDINYNNFYEVYSIDPFIHAKELATELFNLDPDGLGRYVYVMTKIYKKHFIISINFRMAVSIILFPKINNIGSIDIIPFVSKPSIFNEDIKLLCMSPEIQLINIYYSLTNPAFIKSWKTDLQYERILSLQLTSTKRNEAKTHFHPFRGILLDRFVPNYGRVLIGSAAINITTNIQIPGMDLLQVITENDFEYEFEEIKKLAEDFNVTYKINDLNIIMDSRLKKMTVFINEHNQKIPIITIFNAAKFDLIPFVPINFLYGKVSKHLNSSIKVGTPFLIMRYKMIDLYLLNIVYKLGSIKIKFMEQMREEILNSYDHISKYYEKKIKNCDIDKFILPLSNYIGRFEQHDLHIKRVIFQNALKSKEEGKFYPNYFPLMHR